VARSGLVAGVFIPSVTWGQALQPPFIHRKTVAGQVAGAFYSLMIM